MALQVIRVGFLGTVGGREPGPAPGPWPGADALGWPAAARPAIPGRNSAGYSVGSSGSSPVGAKAGAGAGEPAGRFSEIHSSIRSHQA